jgi:Rieske Fe-S protein
VLAGVGLVGLTGVITACGGGGSSSAPAASTAAGQGASSAPAANALAATSAIPVGSGTIFTGPKVVVTQPSAGEFHAFSAVCTHMGCIVGQVSNGTIDCPCHGSQYNIATGAVVGGPAPAPLPPRAIKVSGGSIFLE